MNLILVFPFFCNTEAKWKNSDGLREFESRSIFSSSQKERLKVTHHFNHSMWKVMRETSLFSKRIAEENSISARHRKMFGYDYLFEKNFASFVCCSRFFGSDGWRGVRKSDDYMFTIRFWSRWIRLEPWGTRDGISDEKTKSVNIHIFKSWSGMRFFSLKESLIL